MTTDDLNAALTGHADRQGGAFATHQALTAGFDSHEISALVRHGRWVRLRRGAYAVRSLVDPLDVEARHRLQACAVALTLRGPSMFSHMTAAIILGLPAYDLDLSEVHVTHPELSGTSRHEAGVWHHTGEVPCDDQVVVDRLTCTSPARTAFDVGRVVPPRSALVVADGALARGATRPQLLRQLERGADWPGSRAAGRALAEADGRSESVGESVARWMFHRVGLPPDELQFEVVTSQGRFRSDFAWSQWRLLGEFDGKIKYGRLLKPGQDASEVLWSERQRELALERAGWSVVRFTWADVMDAAVTRDRLLSAVARSQQRAG